MSDRKFLGVSPLSFKMLIYGAFSVICHLVAILLHFLWYADSLPGTLLIRTSASMIEYSLISIIAILIGALLLEILELQKDNEPQE